MRIKALPVRSLVIAASIAAALVAIYAIFGFFAVPRLLRSVATETIARDLGRELQLGEIRFNPFTFTLEVREARLPDADGAVLVSFQRLLVNAQLSSLWYRGVVLRTLEIDAPYARVAIRPGGELNLADLQRLVAASPADTAEPAKKEDKPLRLRLDRLAIGAGSVLFQDFNRRTPFETRLQPISFELRAFSTLEASDNAYHLAARSASGESLDWSGSVFLNPLRSSGRFTVQSLQARTVWGYIRDAVAFELSSGSIGFHGGYDISTADGPLRAAVSVDELAIEDLGLRPRGAPADYVHLDRTVVEKARADLGAHRLDVAAVRVAGGSIRTWIDAGDRINLLELAATPGASDADANENESESESESGAQPVVATAAAQEPSAESADSEWAYSIPTIEVAGVKIEGEDRRIEPHAALTLDDVAVRVAGLASDVNQPLDLTVAFGIGKGHVRTEGRLERATGAARAHLELDRIDLTAVQPYLTQFTDMTLQSGALAAKLDIERDAKGVLAARGGVDVANLKTIDNQLRRDFVKWDRLAVEGLDYRSEPASLHIRRLVTRAPYARVIIAADQSVNVTHVLTPPHKSRAAAATPTVATKSPAPAPSKAAESAPMHIAIDSVQVSRGSANFADFWIQPNFAVGIQELTGTITGLSSDASSRAKMSLKGTVDRYAPAVIEGEINPLAAAVFSDVRMSFKNMEMTSVTPYSGHFAGYKIQKGKLSVDLAYHIENRALKADHRFVIDQLQLGERVESPDAVKLPIRLAVALLKDRNGVIDVSLPVTGSLDNPQFRVGPLIWKAVVNLLVKAATAPFALLGSLVGGGEEINQIDFLPGSAQLEATAQERLKSLAKALVERPGLELEVPAAFSAESDRAALTRARLAAKLAGKDGEAAPTEPAPLYARLLEVYRADSGKEGVLPPLTLAYESDRKRKRAEPPGADLIAEFESALTARITVDETELEALGKARAAAIQDALLSDGAIDPARLFVINAMPAGAEGDVVRLALSLK